MTSSITSKQMTITPAIRYDLEEKFNKLNTWHTHLINPHFILSKKPDTFVIDATITTKGAPLIATAKHNDMYIAINDLINKLERQLNKTQHKFEARGANDSIKNHLIE